MKTPNEITAAPMGLAPRMVRLAIENTRGAEIDLVDIGPVNLEVINNCPNVFGVAKARATCSTAALIRKMIVVTHAPVASPTSPPAALQVALARSSASDFPRSLIIVLPQRSISVPSARGKADFVAIHVKSMTNKLTPEETLKKLLARYERQ